MDCYKWINKRMRKLKCYDISFIKFCVIATTLGIVSGWELFQNWVIGIEWYWFIGAAIIFGILPLKHFLFD
jgi:hypothetical protein